MRGKDSCVSVNDFAHRITPAYAGKSCTSSHVSRLLGDHPRVCGEKCRRYRLFLLPLGSPPRMRGKGPLCHAPCIGPRITPAYAGKSRSKPYRLSVERDHPRVCGEKSGGVQRMNKLVGSPPRMRGKVLLYLRIFAVGGITPAYAGKRYGVRRGDGISGDHPRVCGEKAILSAP